MNDPKVRKMLKAERIKMNRFFKEMDAIIHPKYKVGQSMTVMDWGVRRKKKIAYVGTKIIRFTDGSWRFMPGKVKKITGV